MTRRKSLASREPNGRPKRAPPDLPSPTEVSRLRDAALSGLRDPVWGSMLGQLLLGGKITSFQFSVGRKWSELVRDYSAASQSPQLPKSANLDPRGGIGPDPDSPEGLREARQQTFVKHQYLAALEVLNRTGEAPKRAVADTCEAGLHPVGLDGLNQLRKGLDTLGAFWSKKK